MTNSFIDIRHADYDAHQSRGLFFSFAIFGASVAAILVTNPAAASDVPVYASGPITEEMLFADDPKDWSRPKAVVAPDFPLAQLEAKATGYVDVKVKVDKTGGVTSARIVKSNPENKAFEGAVNETVKMWRFHQRLNRECEPEDATTNVRVWFELRDGKGVVSISGIASDAAAPAPAGAGGKSLRASLTNRQSVFSQIRYPVSMRSARIQANVLAVMKVNSVSGDVTDVKVTWIETFPHTTTANRHFTDEISKRLILGKFAPRLEAKSPTYNVCVPVQFRFS
ncbi:MAG: TonB family protein [Betaproteobacteria bacterium]